MITERTCNKCKAVKPLDMFSPNRRCVGGRLATCKQCRSTQNSADRKAKAIPKDGPTAWLLPRDSRKASDRLLDLELRRWPALESSNDNFMRWCV